MPVTREQSDEIKSIVNVAIKQVWMDENFIKTLVDKVSTQISNSVTRKLTEYDKEIATIKKDIAEVKNVVNTDVNSLSSTLNAIKSENEKNLNKLETMEQELKRNNLRIFNVKEKTNENTMQEVINLINSKLQLDIRKTDIETCYRVGKMEKDKTRGIFLKVTSFYIKQNIYLNKKLLKGTGVVISEDLTAKRKFLLDETIKKYSLKDVWTNQGKIYVKINNRIKSINTVSDI